MRKGLVNDYEIYVFGTVYVHAKMQYDKNGRLVKGRISFDNVTYQDVVFEYEKNRIVKETFYEAGTSNVVDIGLTTYNNKGQVIRREDPFYDLYTTFEYDAAGNNVVNELRYLSSNFLVVRIVFDYNKHIKNPATARPGLPSYDWWYINQVTSPFEPTEWDEYQGDGVGGEFMTYDEDPSKTIITPTTQNLAGKRTAFDNIFAAQNYQYWEYENCGGNNESASVIGNSLPKMDQRSRDIAQLRLPLLRGPGLSKQLAERREKLKSMYLKNK
jgi:hypothetical protein